MFLLKLYDRNGTELNLGDIVAISDGKRFTFYAEVKYLEKEQIITPFHTFSFHSFVKIDSIPSNAVLSTEDRYKIWYIGDGQASPDKDAKEFKNYLMSWRQCEHLIDSSWKIELRNSLLK